MFILWKFGRTFTAGSIYREQAEHARKQTGTFRKQQEIKNPARTPPRGPLQLVSIVNIQSRFYFSVQVCKHSFSCRTSQYVIVNTDTQTVCSHWFIVETSTSTNCCPAAEEALKRSVFFGESFFFNPKNVHAKLCNAESFSTVNNASVESVQYRRCSQWTWSHKEVVVGDLLVLCKKWLGPATKWETVQKLIPLGFCIQACETAGAEKKKTTTKNWVHVHWGCRTGRGTTLDPGEDRQRGTESTLWGRIIKPERFWTPIQNLSFNLTSIA